MALLGLKASPHAVRGKMKISVHLLGSPWLNVLNIDSNFRHLDLGEREFFGLMFNDSGADHVPVGHSPDVMRWLDPTKLIRKQVRVNGVQKTNVTPVATLYFRVKFYVTDPSRYHSYIT